MADGRNKKEQKEDGFATLMEKAILIRE